MELIKAPELRVLCYLIWILLTMLFCNAFFFLIIDLHSLIPTVIAQIFNPIAEFVI